MHIYIVKVLYLECAYICVQNLEYLYNIYYKTQWGKA